MTGSGRVTRRTGLRGALAATVAVPLLTTFRPSDGPLARRTPQEPPDAPPLEVMSFNVRYAGTQEPNSWAVRRPVMRALLRRAAPHVIGTQEGQYPQLNDVEADLGPHYDWIGTGRHVGGGEIMAVFYDTRRLTPVDHAHFWLSDTPEVPGSRSWGAALPRTVTWVRFRDRLDGGRQFCVLNTHLDHASAAARARAADLIARRVPRIARSQPLLVTGDFNAAAHTSEVHGALLGAGLVDTWDTAERRGPSYGTFHGYRPLRPDGERIDWILATPDVTALRTSVDTYAHGGQWPSDHLPVRATLRLG
ncbi:endonuclease/exonuclease/phosphatase family protein [Streptomyces sp. NPDC018693]|uniref:endonuclease/exonuclease/phosphatase family protein n=1 Tax=unclassified Streptomyces TaxID=2593676 RepID=UPI0037BDCD42